MPETFYRFGEWVVPPVVAMNGTKFTFRGLENIPARGGALLAQNHTSYLDWLPPLFAARERGRRMYFMIKAEMADVKAVNYVIKHARLIPVDRRQGHDAFDTAVQRLREGELIGMHPEATISRSFELREFKTGAARMALEAQAPIVPLIVWGAHRIWPKDHEKKLFRNKVPVTVAAGRPLPPHGTAEELNVVLRAAMNELLYQVQEEYPHPEGEYWVPRRLGGSAPTREDSKAMRLNELQQRLDRFGTDGVTRPGQAKAERIDRLLRKQIGHSGLHMILPALIACDVDGTLLGEDEKVTARTRDAVRAAIDAGVLFVLATGRPPRWIPPVVDGLGFAPIAVCANGGVIYDPETDRVLSAKTLSVDALCELAEIATRVIPGAGLAVERVGASAHDSATPQFVSSPGYEHAWLNPDNTEVSLDDLLSAPAVKLLVRKAGARSADLAAALAKHVGVEGDITYSTNNGLVEIVPVGVDKANGIAEIAGPLGIPESDWVTFGDMPNDVPMLLRAGLGVAMANAHPDALAAADEITTTNADDGVARVLERWWL